MCDDNEIKHNVLLESAKELLSHFVYNSKECYGDTFCVYNVHGLIHIADDVEYFKKSLQAISAFAFENYLQELKRFVRSRHNPVGQIVKCLGKLEGLSREQKSLELKTSDNIRDSCFVVENGVVIIQNKLHNGDFVCDFYHKILLEDFLDTFVPCRQFDIFYVKGHIQPRHVTPKKYQCFRRRGRVNIFLINRPHCLSVIFFIFKEHTNLLVFLARLILKKNYFIVSFIQSFS